MSPEEQTTPLDCLASCSREQCDEKGQISVFLRSTLAFSSNDTSDSQHLIRWKRKLWLEGPYLLAEVSDATDLEGARGLRVLHLQVHGASHALGHGDALQQRRVQVEMIRHGAP